jgi:hypothetical protein
MLLPYSKTMNSINQVAFSLRQIYKFYYDLAQVLTRRNLRILKTDSHNESGIYSHSIPLLPVLSAGNSAFAVEIDENTLRLSAKLFPNLDIQKGDIRYLEYEKNFFDVVVDFSTIDHVKQSEYRKVLENYSRISKFCSIIVWLSSTEASTDEQSFFDPEQFNQDLNEIFPETNFSQLIFGDNTKQLWHYIVGVEPSDGLMEEIRNLWSLSRATNLELDDLSKEMQQRELIIKNSWSWRITSPMRQLSLRKIKEE